MSDSAFWLGTSVAMMAANPLNLWSCALPELGVDAPESMAMMAANSADAASQDSYGYATLPFG